jgi:hypothetical protein
MFEERGNEHDAKLARNFAETIGDRAGKGIGEIEERRIFDRAKVRREEKLLRHHDVRAIGRSLADELLMMIEGLGLGREGFRLEQGDAGHGVGERKKEGDDFFYRKLSVVGGLLRCRVNVL